MKRGWATNWDDFVLGKFSVFLCLRSLCTAPPCVRQYFLTSGRAASHKGGAATN